MRCPATATAMGHCQPAQQEATATAMGHCQPAQQEAILILFLALHLPMDPIVTVMWIDMFHLCTVSQMVFKWATTTEDIMIQIQPRVVRVAILILFLALHLPMDPTATAFLAPPLLADPIAIVFLEALIPPGMVMLMRTDHRILR